MGIGDWGLGPIPNPHIKSDLYILILYLYLNKVNSHL